MSFFVFVHMVEYVHSVNPHPGRPECLMETSSSSNVPSRRKNSINHYTTSDKCVTIHLITPRNCSMIYIHGYSLLQLSLSQNLCP